MRKVRKVFIKEAKITKHIHKALCSLDKEDKENIEKKFSELCVTFAHFAVKKHFAFKKKQQ
jgi:hypothetical protein